MYCYTRLLKMKPRSILYYLKEMWCEDFCYSLLELLIFAKYAKILLTKIVKNCDRPSIPEACLSNSMSNHKNNVA